MLGTEPEPGAEAIDREVDPAVTAFLTAHART
jgi:hypothetical protein